MYLIDTDKMETFAYLPCLQDINNTSINSFYMFIIHNKSMHSSLYWPSVGVAPMQWMKISQRSIPIYMVFSTGLYKEICVQMLRIYANYKVGMIKSSVYGHEIKLVIHFLRENIIRSENLIEKYDLGCIC